MVRVSVPPADSVTAAGDPVRPRSLDRRAQRAIVPCCPHAGEWGGGGGQATLLLTTTGGGIIFENENRPLAFKQQTSVLNLEDKLLLSGCRTCTARIRRKSIENSRGISFPRSAAARPRRCIRKKKKKNYRICHVRYLFIEKKEKLARL